MPDETTVAIVTGGGGALGSAIGRQLRLDGHHVVLADVNETAAAAAADTLSSEAGRAQTQVTAEQVDVADLGSIRDLVQRVAARFGRIDVLVNNAAVQRRGSLADVAIEDWDFLMNVDLRGPLLMAQAIFPYWEKQRAGSVVNIASRVWVSGGAPTYVAAKAGVVGLTRSMATELAPLGVTANAVAPSFVATEFTRGGRNEQEFAEIIERNRKITPLGRLAEPEDIAHSVAFLASPRARHITGEVLHVCGGSQMAPLT